MAESTDEEDLSGQGSGALDRIADLLALHLIRNAKQEDQIALLNRAGYPRKDIARLVGTTPQTVSNRLYEQRQKSKAKPKK